MPGIFETDYQYKVHARAAALVWTFLILLACYTPGKELPKVDVPFLDKWTHLGLFGVFVFLWWCGYPGVRMRTALLLMLAASALGGAIELLQGWLTFLGRSMELADWVADTLGGALGAGMYAGLGRLYRR